MTPERAGRPWSVPFIGRRSINALNFVEAKAWFVVERFSGRAKRYPAVVLEHDVSPGGQAVGPLHILCGHHPLIPIFGRSTKRLSRTSV